MAGLLDILTEIMRAKGPRQQNRPENLSSLIPQEDTGGLLGRMATGLAPIPVVGDIAGAAKDAHMYATDPASRTPGNFGLSAMGLLPFVPTMAGVMTYHGTPHKFDKFDLSKIGTGEGAQSYGHGIYFAENPQVAGVYKEALSKPEVADYAGNVIHKTQEFTGIRTPEQNAANLLEYAFAAQSSAPYQLARDMARRSDDAELHKSTIDVLNKWQELGAKPKAGGALYKQDLPDEVLPSLLQWDKLLKEQPTKVRETLARGGLLKSDKITKNVEPNGRVVFSDSSGNAIAVAMPESLMQTGGGRSGYRLLSMGPNAVDVHLSRAATDIKQADKVVSDWWSGDRVTGAELVTKLGNNADTADTLRSLGIPGLSYFDAGSRNQVQKWIAQHPQGGQNIFNTKAEAAAFVKRNPEFKVVDPGLTMNHVIWDQGLLDRMRPIPVE